MTDSTLTHLLILMDRSGSMYRVAKEAENGINKLIAEQAAQPGRCLVTIEAFSDEATTLVERRPAGEVRRVYLEPHGGTALFDAMCGLIDREGRALAVVPEEQRPGLVVVAIVTDGEENASRRYSLRDVRERVERQQGQYAWQFTFLGANLNAFMAGGAMGIPTASIAQYQAQHIGATYSALSGSLTRARVAACAGQVASVDYTLDERATMEGGA